MDLIPVIDNQEYVSFDRNFAVVRFSPNIQKYAAQPVEIDRDIRLAFPEIFGLESVCQAILLGESASFVLESVSRDGNTETDRVTYFNLYIKPLAENLILLVEDVSEIVLLRQSSMQKLNEAEIALNKLQRFEYCTNKIIASMRDLLLITTPKGVIERVNRATTDLFGHKKLDLLNRSIDNIICDRNFNHQEIYNDLLSSPDAVNKIEVSFTNDREREIKIEFECFLAPTEVKNFFSCVYIGRDITARKKAELEIRKSLAREKELRQLKSGFISMASHEFRNPLSSILLCVQNLEGENLNESDRKFYLESIQDAALNMNSLLEDVLIISKAESGKQSLKSISLNLEEFCQQIIQELTAIYADREVAFEYLLVDRYYHLDKATLRHILNNLLSNALKYSPSNSTVNLKVSGRENQDTSEIIIEVRDRGIGIPEESQKHLFESFYRATNVGNTPGTGLGLSIVKKAVELYQGTITVDSQLNRGTTIVVKLPLTNEL